MAYKKDGEFPTPYVSGKRIPAWLVLGLSLVLGACSRPNTPPPGAAAEATPAPAPSRSVAKIEGPVPDSLTAANKTASEIFRTVNAGDWSFSAGGLSDLQNSLAQLRSNLQPIVSSDSGRASLISPREDEMDSEISLIRDAIANKRRDTTLRESNRITRILAELVGMYSDPVAGELLMLRYDARQVGMAASTNDHDAVAAAVDDIRRRWQGLKPAVEANGGAKEAQAFSDLIATMDQGGNTGQLPALLGDRISDVEQKLQH